MTNQIIDHLLTRRSVSANSLGDPGPNGVEIEHRDAGMGAGALRRGRVCLLIAATALGYGAQWITGVPHLNLPTMSAWRA
jgi:hypothetical protein